MEESAQTGDENTQATPLKSPTARFKNILDREEKMDRSKYRYNHIGIPTATPHPGERYLPEFKMYVYGYETNGFNIEWMRFDAGCPLPELVKTVPHVAFEVDDLEAALVGREVIIPTNSPSPEVKVAFIRENDAPVELMQFSRPERD